MSTVLVTGGAGYIGSHTLRHLLDQGYKCVVVDNLCLGHKEAVDARASFEKGDISDSAFLNSVFEKYQISSVVHFAAFAYVGESVLNPEKYYLNNVSGTLSLLEAMRVHGVNNIVFSSTCATYGEPQYLPLDEKHPQNPINPYGRSKLMIEKILSDYRSAYGLNYIALRYFNAAGCSSDAVIGESHTPETHVIPLLLKAILSGGIFSVYGSDYDTRDGSCIRDYIHVEDLADAHRKALEKISTFSGCINLGTDQGVTVKEMINRAFEVTGKTCHIAYVDRRPGDPSALFADNSLAKKVLGWTPSHSDISNILQTAVNWELKKRY